MANGAFPSFIVDVPMSRVKFNVNTEYAYLQNFKVLQSMSRRDRHRVGIPPLTLPFA